MKIKFGIRTTTIKASPKEILDLLRDAEVGALRANAGSPQGSDQQAQTAKRYDEYRERLHVLEVQYYDYGKKDW